MPPVIGITAGRTKNEYDQSITTLTEAYVEAVVQAGGLPVIIPPTAAAAGAGQVYARLDGLLFTGGGDIAPQRYGGEAHPKVDGVDADRDALELDLLGRALEDGKPLLGICRGFQLVNVGLGGTLYSHLPEQLAGALHHDNPGNKRHDLVHEVELSENARISRIMGVSRLRVNSHHHQGVQRLGPSLCAVGSSSDGLIEAIELPDHPFAVAVQWHPEWLTDMEPTRKLFRELIRAASPS